MKIDLKQRKELIVFGTLIIFAYLIGGRAIYASYLHKIDALSSQIEDEQKKNEIIADISILDKKAKVYKQRSFSASELTQVLDKVSALAQQAEIKIETFNPLAALDKEKYIELPIQLPLRCSYHQLGKFLSLLESNQEFIKVKKLKVYKSSGASQNEPEVDLTLYGIYLKK